MKIGNLIVTTEGLQELSEALMILGAKSAMLEVHQTDDTHRHIRLCLKPEAGWIDIDKGWIK